MILVWNLKLTKILVHTIISFIWNRTSLKTLKTTGTQLWYNKCNIKSNSAIWQHIPCFLRETVSSPYWFYINKETLQGLERQVKELGVNITNGDVRHKLLVTKVNVKYLYNNLYKKFNLGEIVTIKDFVLFFNYENKNK